MSRSSLAQLMRLVEKESIDGIKLLENPNDNPICSLSYDETICCVTIVWRRYATSAQLRFVHEAIIQMLAQYGANKILGDDSDLPIVHAEDQKWITEDWMPRAKAAGLRPRQPRFRSRFSAGFLSGAFRPGWPVKLPSGHSRIFTRARTWLRAFLRIVQRSSWPSKPCRGERKFWMQRRQAKIGLRNRKCRQRPKVRNEIDENPGKSGLFLAALKICGLVGLDGGRDRDRTCDPLDVNEVLSSTAELRALKPEGDGWGPYIGSKAGKQGCLSNLSARIRPPASCSLR